MAYRSVTQQTAYKNKIVLETNGEPSDIHYIPIQVIKTLVSNQIYTLKFDQNKTQGLS